VAALRRRAVADPGRWACSFLADGERDEQRLSYGGLDLRARAVAARLQALDLTGERVLLLFPAGLEYAAALLGCFYAGAVAVPSYPPTGSRGAPRLAAILADCAARCVLTTAALRPAVEALGTAAVILEIGGGADAEAAVAVADTWRDPGVRPETLALLQYTSGSTSTPKGVMISHGNLAANQAMIGETFGTSEDSVVVSWLPLYHDMGLIGGLLHPLWRGAHCVLLSPLHFLQRPRRWPEAIARFGADVSGGPNFAYELCARKIKPGEVAALDLSRWRVAFNGAEPVRAEVLDRFAQVFAPSGFRASSFFPCYGLAEATLLVSGGRALGANTSWANLSTAALAAGRVEPVEASEDGARRLVGCGPAATGLDVRVVAPETRTPCPADAVGEIWVAGASVAAGYWDLLGNRPETTAETFGAYLDGGEGPYLRTGDLGFFLDGALYVAGRIKDLILIRGRNLHPQDVEWTVERSHPAVRAGGGAAFSVDADGEERLVVVQEVGLRGEAGLDEVAAVAETIRRAVAEEHEVRLWALVLVKPGEVPKTTSGKLQRRACRDLFLSGGLHALGTWREDGPAGMEPEEAEAAPLTPMEERLARSWEEVLELPRGSVRAGDSFFALGGDSLRAAQLLARVLETEGLEIPLDELFAAPTLGALATLVEARAGAGGDREGSGNEPRIERRADSGRPLPLTSPQRRLWFLDQLEPGNPAYNLGVAVRFSGALDAEALARALGEIVRRHEALRTVFRVLDDVPAQLVLPPDPADLPNFPLARVDVSVDAEPERAAAELERELARDPFEIDRGPLLRARLVTLAPEEHELHLAVHHLVADGWSFGVLLRELALLYTAFAEGRPSPLPELPVQYGDYASWLERRLAGDALAQPVAVWKRRLAGTLPILELPADRPRPQSPSYRGAHAVHPLPAALVDGLRELSGRHGASLFMGLAAGFQTLLGRLTAQDDVIAGTAVANRDRVELEGLIGFFVNTLPLRSDLSGDPAFAGLLEQVRGTVLEALAGSQVPFERLVDELEIRRDLTVPPVVQVMLVLQNEPLRMPPVPGLTVRGRETDNGTARFDLAVSLLAADEGLSAVFKYSRDLFDAATIERLAGHFTTLLASALAGPERRLSELPLLAAAERQQIVVDWNATEAPEMTSAGCLHELIEAQAERTPDLVAVTCEGESLTYRELSDRAERLAQHLRRLGVAPEVLVGVAVERSVELMVGLFGVLKAGGAYVPLDPAYPAERLAFMVDDAAVPVLLTQERLLERVPAGRARVVCLGEAAKDIKDINDIKDTKGRVGEAALSFRSLQSFRSFSTHPAYCIYTSGSTGRPKGAVNTHRGIVNRLLWMQSEYGLRPGEGVLQKTPVSFDVSVWELFWPLLTGARVVFARPGGHQDSAYLAELIRRERITTLHFVPSMLQVFLEEPTLGECASLRRVITSGEALPRELEERFGSLLGPLGTELHNLYGPTEAAVDVTAWPCLREPEARTVPIGRPISNLQIHLLDPAGRPAPVGVPGHLHIGGVGLARGYWRRPELTAEKFVPNPFRAGERLYASGDLARRRPDGVIEFLGRIDHQVKIRGLRIELGEIEAALNAHPAVRESVVLAREDDGTGPRLVAYVVAGSGAAADVDELRSFLAARLPDYMVPPVFVLLPALPLNPSGKVDRKALPAPEEPHRPEATLWMAPRTPVEERLAALWSEVLGVERGERIGVFDDFFALGGDSIQGALLVNRLQRELSAIVYVMALFDAPTVGQLAAYLETSYHDALVAAGWISEGSGAGEAAGPVDAATEAAEIEALSQYLATRFSHRTGSLSRPGHRNRPAVFLLSPFRSGSTLLRVMLAGHPGLFAPPELELLGFETMGERRRVFAGRDSFSREGLLRAVMELRGCDAEAATALLAEAEERDEPVPAFYARLQEWIGDRLLVDKTPRYALDLATLRRAEDWFDRPLYVHLVRHPVATMQSYLEAKMQEVYRFPLPHRRQAELVWRLGHEHILEHLDAVPRSRRHGIRFEEMVRDPRSAMEDLCAFLGIGFAPAMLSPYEGKRMTDGLHGAGRMMGDPKFHQHQGIDAGAADRWKGEPAGDPGAGLGEATWALAARLGYERPGAAAAAPEADPGPRPLARPHQGEMPLSFSQQRLWFLDRLAPGTSVYNMPAAVRLSGPLEVTAMARACAEVERRHEVLRTAFPAVSGRPQQAVGAPRAADLPVVDLGGLAAPVREAVAARLAGEEAHRPFDLAAGPVWRVLLLRLAAAEHLLVVNLHHIVCDGWSVGVLTRELTALYAAFRQGLPSPLRELPFQYADFADWQRRRLSGPLLAELLGYWKERLAGPLPALDLPLDRPRPLVRTYRGDHLPVAIPAAVAQAFKELGRREGATLFMALVAAFQALLARYTGQEDLVIGAPVAGRNRAELESLIGSFVNTLVLRLDLSGDPDVRSLLGRARQVCLGATRHEELPFEKLVEELGVERSPGHAPLVSVVLAWQNAPPEALALPGLNAERVNLATRSAKFDLVLNLSERRADGALAGLSGEIEYDADLFDRATVARLAGHLTTLLRGAAEAPASRLSALPLLTAAERHHLVAGGNDTRTSFPADATIYELFAATVRRRPEAVAVSCAGERLSYAELAARAERLADLLVRLGVGPEVLVGIYAERTPAMLAAVLAVLAAGGAYVPVDPATPPARLCTILEDSGAAVLLTERPLAASLPPHGARVVLLDADGDAEPAAGAGETAAPPRRRPFPESLAYVIYTSGSTGRPKGVAVTHRAVLRLVLDTDYIAFGPADRVAWVSNASFDAATFEIWGALLNGACLAAVGREVMLEPRAFAAALGDGGITTIFLTTALFNQLAREAPGAFAPLHHLLFGGEMADPETVRRVLRDGPPRRLLNAYGPTEGTTFTSWHLVDAVAEGSRTVPIGRPLANTVIHLVDRNGRLVPLGVAGELSIGGEGLARGYHGRPDRTAETFVPDPFGAPGARLYRTGDLARRLPDGRLDCLGRLDNQVKVRGFRIELGEIEAVLREHPAVGQCAVALTGRGADRRLAAYIVRAPGAEASWDELRGFLAERLPLAMIPAAVVFLDRFPLLPSGKIDRKALPEPGHDRPELGAAFVAPDNAAERAVAAIWQEVLGLDRIGIDDNFFDLGGHSLLAAEVHGKLRERLGTDVSLLELFQYPTVRALAGRLAGRAPETRPAARRPVRGERAADPADSADPDIAVIGMACRYPGAPDLAAFWRLLREGVDAISRLSGEELLAAGVDPALLANPRYVRARGVIPGADLFDAPFFGFSPREAAMTDPQQRVLLEQAWEALEHAAVDPATFPGRIGVYAGATISTYLLANLLSYGPSQEEAWAMVLANDKDTLATRVAYKLGLRGPALTVSTGCSTSLVAVHLARQALLADECDVALAGGVSVRSAKTGYLYQEDGIQSPDGCCRAFDAEGRGTVFSSGAGLVVLKRLADAVEDGDTIHAVLKGSALNNDGEHKIGFTAPSADGQAEVISRALELAGVDPEEVQYVEAHGTATPLGDPIEAAGLTRAFRDAGATRRGYCAIGSVKTNIGHTDSAAGVAGLIKTVLALEHREIPPSLHFERPNPQIDFGSSPFYVNNRLRPWKSDNPRRAGVSSFGIGGTNAHAVVEEAPAPRETDPPARPWQLLALSAKTPAALEALTARLAGHLAEMPENDPESDEEEAGKALADVAFTLQAGRRALPWRRTVVCRDRADAVVALADRARRFDGAPPQGSLSLAFLLPGQGSQRPGMTAGLYAAEPLFRREVDRMAEILRSHLGGEDLREILYPSETGSAEAARRLDRTSITQPALFVVETALARLWMSWGVRPQALLGHSIGEYVAAHLAGVFSLEDALELVAARGRLIAELPGGAMLAVALAEADVLELLGTGLSLAAVNGPGQCVVSGSEEAVEALHAELLARGVTSRRLATSHAFHSRQMEPLLEPFTRLVRRAAPKPPQIPFLSNVTGRWITAEEATDPAYWARHLRQPVRFVDGLAALFAEPSRALLEVGPGRALTGLARRLAESRGETGRVLVPSLPPVEERVPSEAGEDANLLGALGRLWAAGIPVDWPAFHAGERRRRVPLPSYPFERRRFWIEPAQRAAGQGAMFPDFLAEEVETRSPEGADDLRDLGDLGDPVLARIAAIWRDVLGVTRIGPHDQFFDLGGDSLIALRVMARLRDDLGVELPVRTLFERPTVPLLREAVEEALSKLSGPSGLSELSENIASPLTPGQRAFFALDLPRPHLFARSLAVALREPSSPAVVSRALGAVVSRHAALQVRFLRADEGEWRQEPAPWLVPPLAVLDLPALPAAARGGALAAAADELAGSLDVEQGPLLRAVLCELGEGGQRLVLVLHDLVADAASWQILLADLDAACRAAAAGGSLDPAPPDLSRLRRWAERLAAETTPIPAGAPQLPRRRPVRVSGLLPIDLPEGRDGAANTAGSARILTAELDAEETRALLSDVPALYHNRLDEALLSAVLQAFAGWIGEPSLLVDVEGSVREEGGEDGLWRTVGRISPLYPVLLDLDPRERDPGALLRAVKEQLRAAARNGSGAFRGTGAPVVFRDLRPFAPGLPGTSFLAPAPEQPGGPRVPGRQRPWLLEIETGMVDGRLCWSWTYSANLHHARTIQGLLDRALAALRSLLAHCRPEGAGAVAFSPADFPAARLSQKGLDKLMSRIGSKRAPRLGMDK
jgi:amino acid adenylation domain-containing protein